MRMRHEHKPVEVDQTTPNSRVNIDLPHCVCSSQTTLQPSQNHPKHKPLTEHTTNFLVPFLSASKQSYLRFFFWFCSTVGTNLKLNKNYVTTGGWVARYTDSQFAPGQMWTAAPKNYVNTHRFESPRRLCLSLFVFLTFRVVSTYNRLQITTYIVKEILPT